MIQLTDAALIANDEAVGIIPNSMKFTEGFGERKVRTASIGGGKVEQIFARDVETALSKLMFDLPTTPENIALAKAWAENGNENTFQIAGATPEGDVTRSFTQAALVNDYEVEIGSEANISIEICSNQAI
jgi:hypothetical protein